jgi:hypothetical protein
LDKILLPSSHHVSIRFLFNFNFFNEIWIVKDPKIDQIRFQLKLNSFKESESRKVDSINIGSHSIMIWNCLRSLKSLVFDQWNEFPKIWKLHIMNEWSFHLFWQKFELPKVQFYSKPCWMESNLHLEEIGNWDWNNDDRICQKFWSVNSIGMKRCLPIYFIPFFNPYFTRSIWIWQLYIYFYNINYKERTLDFKG